MSRRVEHDAVLATVTLKARFRSLKYDKDRQTYEVVVGEAFAPRDNVVKISNLLFAQGNFKSFNVGMQMFNLAPADDREHIWNLLLDICDGNYNENS